jgi:tetratricopeptide (TPR) repeat protein
MYLAETFQNFMTKNILFGLTLVACLLLSGCAFRWNPAVESVKPASASEEASMIRARADACVEKADTRETVSECLDLYKQALSLNPADYPALVQSSNLHILMGTAYTKNKFEKSDHFKLAMHYAELAMYTNPDFLDKVSNGYTLWEAAVSLTQDELEAVFFWVTALQYEFKEGMSLPSKIINIRWMQRALVLLERIKQVDPEFGGGGVEFAEVICYYALPESMGGSKETGDQLMQEAVEKGDSWLLPRWARGKYYYTIKGDKQAQKEDLEWVATQPLDKFNDPYPWRVHFVENAQELVK